MIVLGIDPGTATTGYGLVKPRKAGGFYCVKYGCITTKSSLPTPKRLQQLFNETSGLILKYKPKALAVENVYFFKNLKTAMPVSQAKGVIMLAAVKKKVPVFEYTPLQIKSAIVGYGNADKQQVQRMIRVLLNLKELPKPDDAADALAAAICYLRDSEGCGKHPPLGS